MDALTKKKIDSLKPEEKPFIVFDEKTQGFGVKIHPSGLKSFILDYRFNGRQRRLVLGRYGVLTVDKARKEAIDKLGDLRDGTDPLEEKRKANRADTIKDLCKLYLEKRSDKKSLRQDENRINNYIIPKLGRLKIESVRRADVERLHQQITESGAKYQANRVLSLISSLFRLAQRLGVVSESFMNPCRNIERNKEKSRDRWVLPEEMPKLWDAIATVENPYIKSALQLLLLTGLRRNELLGLRWDNVNLNRKTIHLDDTKAGRPFDLPLSDFAVEIFLTIPKQDDNPFVFCGAKEGCHLVEIKRQWNRVRKDTGLEDVRLHDLRRTVGSWLATSGKSIPLIGRVLNQTSQHATAIYSRLSQDPVREAMEQHSKQIIDITTLRDGKNNAEKTA